MQLNDLVKRNVDTLMDRKNILQAEYQSLLIQLQDVTRFEELRG
jgi:hypothetical protein